MHGGINFSFFLNYAWKCQKFVKLLKIAKLSLIISLSKWLYATNLTFVNNKDVILPDYKSSDSRYKYFSCYEHLKMRFLLKMADFQDFHNSRSIHPMKSIKRPFESAPSTYSIFWYLTFFITKNGWIGLFCKNGWFLGFSQLKKYSSYEVK